MWPLLVVAGDEVIELRLLLEDARRFKVVAVKPNGKHVPTGTCPTREAAESWAALLTKYGRLAGTYAYVAEAEREAAT